jgi:acyl carrier protein
MTVSNVSELSTRDKIMAIVDNLLALRAKPRALALDDSLRDAGLTSLDMANMVLKVEAACNVTIPDRDITPANFRSIAAIDRLVSGLRPQA